jgi:4-hydroxy-tetrahydrodipicolinate synthase
MMTASRLHGIFPAIPTPINADDTVNVPATKSLFKWLLSHGVDGVVPIGGTGEYGSLAQSQRIRMVEMSVEAMAGKRPVIAGVLDTGYYDALHAGHDFAEAGADALLVLTPYYTNPTQTGIRDYFLRYADNARLPILVYEIPYRTRIAIQPEVLHELSRHERIIGMKACNTDMYHFQQVVAGVDSSFSVLSGEDSLFPLHMVSGAHGGILVTASLLPRTWRRMLDLVEQGQVQDALALHRKLIPLMNLAFAETNPGPLKSVLDLIGVDAPRVLAPLVRPAVDLQNRLRAECIRQLAVFDLEVLSAA